MEGNTKLFFAPPEKQASIGTALQQGEAQQRGPQQGLADSELLIRDAFDTDPKAGVELLYRHYYQPLCSHALRLLSSRSIAEDLVSDIFYQFYANEAYLKVRTSFRAYLYRSVRNQALNYKRNESRRSQDIGPCAEWAEAERHRPDALAEYEELYQRLQAGIRELPTQRRRIFMMHRFEDKKYAEIARELALSPRTVEVQIRKASLFLRELFLRFT